MPFIDDDADADVSVKVKLNRYENTQIAVRESESKTRLDNHDPCEIFN